MSADAPKGHGLAPGEESFATSYTEALKHDLPFQDKDGTLIYTTFRSRPAPVGSLDSLHRTLGASAVVIALVSCVMLLWQAMTLDGHVPVHFGFDGSVNREGSPWELAGANVMMFLVVLGTAILARYPRIFNYPCELTPDNVQRYYQVGARTMIYLSFGSAVICVSMISPSLIWLSFLGMALMLLSCVWSVAVLMRQPKSQDGM